MIGRRPFKHAIKVGHHTLQPGGVHTAMCTIPQPGAAGRLAERADLA